MTKRKIWFAGSRKDMSLTTNGRFRMANIYDLTAWLNTQASEGQFATLEKLRVIGRFQISNIQDAQSIPLLGYCIIRTSDTAVITETETTTENDLQLSFENKINTSFEVLFLSRTHKLSNIFYHDTGTTWSHLDTQISWTVPKNLKKWGNGAQSEEMAGIASRRLFLCCFVFSGVPISVATTIYALQQLEFQYNIVDAYAKNQFMKN